MAQHTDAWPSLRVDDWIPTRDTLHMWTQIVGKIRLTLTPLVNHWWQVTSYVTARGLSTSAIPYGTEAFDIEFDFIDHELVIRSSTGAIRTVALEPKSVAEFYSQTMQALDELGLHTRIQSHPNEVDPALRFAEDRPARVVRPCRRAVVPGANCLRPAGYSASSGPASSEK